MVHIPFFLAGAKTTQKSNSPSPYTKNTRHCLTNTVNLRTKYLHNPEVTPSSTRPTIQPTSQYSRHSIFTRPGGNEQAAFNLPIITPSDLLPSFHSFPRIASAGFMQLVACNLRPRGTLYRNRTNRRAIKRMNERGMERDEIMNVIV